MALGGNRNTAYCHALFTYNQRVKCIGDRYGNKNRKTFSYKNHKGRSKPLFALPFACIGNCAEIMNFIMRTHPLHFTTSSTSFHEFIYFISRVHLLHWVDTYGCGGWRSRMQWLKETNAMAEGVECSDRKRRMRLLKESNAIAEGVECGGWRSRMRWPEETNAVTGGDECCGWRRHILNTYN